jgi:hypothetical protein
VKPLPDGCGTDCVVKSKLSKLFISILPMLIIGLLLVWTALGWNKSNPAFFGWNCEWVGGASSSKSKILSLLGFSYFLAGCCG